MMTDLNRSVSIHFYDCGHVFGEIRRRYDCDWWVYDWIDIDYYWLFGSYFPWIQPMPDHSPLALYYYSDVTGKIANAINQARSQCESSRYAQQPVPKTGVSISVASRLEGGHAGNAAASGISAQLSVQFSAASGNNQPTSCPMVRRELFVKPAGFDYVIHGPGNNNYRWDGRVDNIPQEPYFERYGRRLNFKTKVHPKFIGDLHLVIDRLADMWVRFESRPIPASVAHRVDPAQPLSYQVSQGSGYFGIAAVIEVMHLESGQVWYQSVHGSGYAPGQMTPYDWWPESWRSMSMDANGIIRHYNVDLQYRISTIDPANIGLPAIGTYRMRCILLGIGYSTRDRFVSSGALGLPGSPPMSWKPIRLSHMPSLLAYTPGMTDGIIPPFEVTYTNSHVLYPADGTGIQFDAVFDMKNITNFRFVVKVGNPFDFAIGLVVEAVGWQAWVSLAPGETGETKYLAGSFPIYLHILHPQSPDYGWERNWITGDISMNNGQCSIKFRLFLTAPNNPETTPANLPALKATYPWDTYDCTYLIPEYEPLLAVIKKYAPDGRYDYLFALQHDSDALALASIGRSITKPSYQPLIDPATYFVTGYQTDYKDTISPWHKRPWPPSGTTTVPIMVNCEQVVSWNGGTPVWGPATVTIKLTRAMLQQVAAMLGVTDYAVMDGDSIRWFVPNANQPTFSDVVWIDTFYTQSGALIDDAAMRSAFQTVIDNNAASSWPQYQNIVIHPSVRFGSFLGVAVREAGRCMLGMNGNMVEVGGFADLGSVGTRCLYLIKPEFK